MFPIVNNLNTLASSVNGLRAEVRHLQSQYQEAQENQASNHNNNQTNAVIAIPLLQQQQSNLDEAFKRVSSQTVQTMQGLVEVRRQLDIVKAELTREISMLETMILRKCEVTMHKMINDKIAVTMEAHRSGLKDCVAQETHGVMEDIKGELALLRSHVDTAVFSSKSSSPLSPAPTMSAADPPLDYAAVGAATEDYDITISKSASPPPIAAPGPSGSKRGKTKTKTPE